MPEYLLGGAVISQSLAVGRKVKEGGHRTKCTVSMEH